jgi:peptidoglycan hydrolase-like protein with peptidoglycan-binding domain
VAMAETLPKAGAVAAVALPKEEPPIRILFTRVSDKVKNTEIEAMLDRLGYQPGAIDGVINKTTRTAIKAYQDVHGQKPTGEITAAFSTSLYRVMNRVQPTGWLYVRRNFKPVFDAPVAIENPQMALGTHFYNAFHANPAQHTVDWYGVSLDNDIPAKTAKRLGITAPNDPLAPDAAEAAFARIGMSRETRDRLETMLGNGSSMTITDIGTESETTEGTDFITILRKAPKA